MIFDLGLVRSLGYYTGAVFQVYDPALRRADRRRRPLRRAARAVRAPAAGRRDSRSNVERLHIALDGGGAMAAELTRAADRRPARGAVQGDARPARRARPRHERGARRTTASCCSRTSGIVTMRPVRRPHLRRGRRRRHRHHRQGRADGAVRARGLRARSTSATGAAGWCSPPSPARTAPAEALRRLGVMRIATKYPRIAGRATSCRPAARPRSSRSRARSSWRRSPAWSKAIVDLTATGTTLRENGLVVREEIAVCTARLIANPVAHKLKARGDRPRCWSASRASLSASTLSGDPAGLAAELRALVPAPESVARARSREIIARVRASGDDAVLGATRRELRHRRR